MRGHISRTIPALGGNATVAPYFTSCYAVRAESTFRTGVRRGDIEVSVVSGALMLAAAMTLLPMEVAGAQTPSTFVSIPSNNATVSGTSQVLDAGASSGVTQVQYEISGGTLTDSVIATATPTIYGWLAKWNTTAVANGTYNLQSVATTNGVSGTSAPVTISVNNPPPSTNGDHPGERRHVGPHQGLGYRRGRLARCHHSLDRGDPDRPGVYASDLHRHPYHLRLDSPRLGLSALSGVHSLLHPALDPERCFVLGWGQRD